MADHKSFRSLVDSTPTPAAYTGIGSRRTPPDVLALMRRAAEELVWRGGWRLRTGGAEGADTYFLLGASGWAEVYLPWAGFDAVNRWGRPIPSLLQPEASPQAHAIAARYHPGWARLSPGARALHARNVHQILGPGLDRASAFVLCWTPDGADGVRVQTSRSTGGTGQAIRIAAAHGVPVFNLWHGDVVASLLEWMMPPGGLTHTTSDVPRR